MRKLLLAFILGALLGLPQPSVAADDRLVLNVEICHQAPPAVLEGLHIGWREFSKYVQICPVARKGSDAALYVLTARADLAGDDFEFMNNFNKNGHGLDIATYILDTDFRFIGKIDAGFPLEPPIVWTMTFLDWHHNFPNHIELSHTPYYYFSNTKIHLYWNPSTYQFQEPPSKPKGRP